MTLRGKRPTRQDAYYAGELARLLKSNAVSPELRRQVLLSCLTPAERAVCKQMRERHFLKQVFSRDRARSAPQPVPPLLPWRPVSARARRLL